MKENHPISLILYRIKSREALRDLVESNQFQTSIIVLILINAVTIGMETSHSFVNFFGEWLIGIDNYILIIFCLELSLKLVAYGWRFFLKPWNIFDFVIVAIALVPATGPLHILRTLRILRTFRLVKNVPKLRMIIESLFYSIPSIGWIIVLLFMIFYIFAVIGTDLFGQNFPEYFGDLGITFFTLFQVMTLESWSSGIARPMMEEIPYAFVFFVPFILLATYTTLNVFIAVVVNTMNEVNRRELREEEERLKLLLKDEHNQLMSQLRKLNQRFDKLEDQLREESEST